MTSTSTATASIGDYGLLSDRHSAALVGRDGGVDWLCFPRFDSPSVFGALLDPGAGRWSLRPAGPAQSTREYLPGTMVLRTAFTTPAGTLEVTDALALGPGEGPHRLGAGAPHLLIRSAACSAGEVELAVEYCPRPEYGLVVPVLRPEDGGLRARGGPAALALSCPVPLTVTDNGTAHGTITLRAGQSLHFALQWAPLAAPRPRLLGQEKIAHRLAETITGWRAWSDGHRGYDGPWAELVRHSGRVLQALSYQPSGALLAAATTSLPEEVGGERNWDYRYTWVRDAALAMDALWVAACPDEAEEFFTFMADAAATASPGAQLQIMYGIGGEHDLTERELPHLRGWRGSRPVRVGNGAWRQHQLDVYGELLATAARFADRLPAADPALRAFLIRLADTAAASWHQPDHGIWEICGESRHYLHSKLMCWVALDRALHLAGRLGADDHHRRIWRQARDRIRTAIETKGFHEQTGAFTQSFGSARLDASALVLPISGFLPASDPRVLATLEQIAARLTDRHGLVRRYLTGPGADGLPGEEGSFLLCTFWLAQAQALAGRTAAARTTFEAAAACANDLGLLSEQAHPATGEALGNFPQAFSHIGLVNAAWAIHQAEQTASEAAPA
ncbi:glycoside hydrolase family 15 protein [Streptomyces sp. YIM 98790]|uniref:glycoside hydrolase family 15 protein n=1 Tax=Streptomyces sp. YIM 98790 TaxID=2689077 RepID=UPI0028BD1F57|nr:glycoside hydrolase family 15 protein [Streptomyces sp. YIM 98790]